MLVNHIIEGEEGKLLPSLSDSLSILMSTIPSSPAHFLIVARLIVVEQLRMWHNPLAISGTLDWRSGDFVVRTCERNPDRDRYHRLPCRLLTNDQKPGVTGN